MIRHHPSFTLFPYTTLFRSDLFMVRFHGRSDSTWNDTSRSAAERFRYQYKKKELEELAAPIAEHASEARESHLLMKDRKSTRLNSSHSQISYAVFCLKKKRK